MRIFCKKQAICLLTTVKIKINTLTDMGKFVQQAMLWLLTTVKIKRNTLTDMGKFVQQAVLLLGVSQIVGTASPSLHPPLPPKSSFTCVFDVSVSV